MHYKESLKLTCDIQSVLQKEKCTFLTFQINMRDIHKTFHKNFADVRSDKCLYKIGMFLKKV